MVRCTYPECGWRSIAASAAGGREQLAEHLVAEHAEEVDADVPDGTVQVRVGEDDEWRTMTFEQAKAFHRAVHERSD